MQEILSLVPHFTVALRNTFPLLFIVPASLFTPGQFFLFPSELLLPLPVVSGIVRPGSITEYRQPLHRIINSQDAQSFALLYGFPDSLVFAFRYLIQD